MSAERAEVASSPEYQPSWLNNDNVRFAGVICLTYATISFAAATWDFRINDDELRPQLVEPTPAVEAAIDTE